jgi:hypothetical protein
MPKLSAVLNDADYTAVDESLKTFYQQNSETKDWWLDVDEPGKLDVTGQKELERLRTHNKTVLGEKKTAAEKLAAYEAFGKSPDELKAALEANRPEEVTKMVADYETKFENLKKSFEEPLSHATERAKKLESQIQQTLAATEIAKLRNEYDLNETADYVLRDFIKVVPKEEGSDEFSVKVYENGQPYQVAGQDVSPSQFIKGLQEAKKFPAMFNAGTGGGTGGTNRQVGANGSKQYEGLSPTEKLNLAREQGVKTP